jgi:hypothetical protein
VQHSIFFSFSILLVVFSFLGGELFFGDTGIFGVFFQLFTCASYIVWVIPSPCPPLPRSSPFPAQFQAGPVLPLSLVLLKQKDKHNKEDKVFLLVELRIAIQKYS